MCTLPNKLFKLEPCINILFSIIINICPITSYLYKTKLKLKNWCSRWEFQNKMMIHNDSLKLKTIYACINVNPEGGGQTPGFWQRKIFLVRNPSPGHYFHVRIPLVNLQEKSFLTHIFHVSDSSTPWGGAGVLCQNSGGGSCLLCQNPGGCSSSPCRLTLIGPLPSHTSLQPIQYNL